MEKRLKCTQKIVSIEELSNIYSPTLQNKIFPIKEFFYHTNNMFMELAMLHCFGVIVFRVGRQQSKQVRVHTVNQNKMD
jgi:hypothetical protein